MSKLQKNHYTSASYIGKHWGSINSKDSKNKNRFKKVFYIDLIDYLSNLEEENHMHRLSYSVKDDKTAEDVLYSKVYLKETEDSIKTIDGKNKKVTDIENKFLDKVNAYLEKKNFHFLNEGCQNIIKDYAVLQLLRTPIHYEMMHYYFTNKNKDILYFHKIIEFNNNVMIICFPKNRELLKDYKFYVVTIEKPELEIFLGSITALTKNSKILNENISIYLNKNNIDDSDIKDLDNFVFFPMTPKKMIVGFFDENKQDNKKIAFFDKNVHHIVNFWNMNQFFTSGEVIVTEKTKEYIDSYFKYNPKKPREILDFFKNQFDYCFNEFKLSQIDTIADKYEKWKKEIVEIYNKHKNKKEGIFINFIPHKFEFVVEKLELKIIFSLENNLCEINYNFEIDYDGCVFINENNEKKIFCYNFYCFFSSLLNKLETPRAITGINGQHKGYTSLNFSSLKKTSFFIEIEKLTNKYYEDYDNLINNSIQN